MYFSRMAIAVVFYGCVFQILTVGCATNQPVAKHKIQKVKNNAIIKQDEDVQKIHWPFSITYDNDCSIRFSDSEMKEIVNIIPLEKNRIIRNVFVNSPDTLSVWIVPTTTFYSGKERTYFLIKADSGKWIVK
jgi:hypothetical protein